MIIIKNKIEYQNGILKNKSFIYGKKISNNEFNIFTEILLYYILHTIIYKFNVKYLEDRIQELEFNDSEIMNEFIIDIMLNLKGKAYFVIID